MNTNVIPPQLQSKLDDFSSSKYHVPLCIETGTDSLGIVSSRLQELVHRLDTSEVTVDASADRPSILVLVSQEYLQNSLTDDNTRLCNSFICLSEEQSPRDDLSTLSSDRTGVLITTPMRAIDHLRRENIDVRRTKFLLVCFDFIRQSEETDEQMQLRSKAFMDDLQYIFTKLNRKVVVECFFNDCYSFQKPPQALIPKSIVLLKKDWEPTGRDVVLYVSGAPSIRDVIAIMYASAPAEFLILCNNRQSCDQLAHMLEQEKPRLVPIILDTSDETTWKFIEEASSGTLLVTYGLDYGEIAFLVRASSYWNIARQRILCLVSPEQESIITQSKETQLMNHETASVPGQEEVIVGKIKLIATDMLTDAHPEELEALKKSIKKQVPLMRRGYFTAYLLRELLQKSAEGSVKERSFEKARRRRPERDGEQTQPPKQKPERAKTSEEQTSNHQNSIPEGARTIYINIGKMRRLYSKDLSQLLQNELEISREEIFSIRVHDKYSFVTLSEAHAELAIAKLNGKEIKGRVASVSYSNKD